MVELAHWSGVVRSRRDDFNDLVLAQPKDIGSGWSGPFRATANDGHDYFVKSLDTCPAGQGGSLAIERIVAQMGEVIGAPVCTTSLVRIPPELAGWEPRPGQRLTAGLAHASKALEHADEAGRPALSFRSQDDNQRRHVGLYALYDWCFGYDAQWLYDLDDDRRIYSHDHGLYLPPVGSGSVEQAALIAAVDVPNELPDARDGLLPAAVDEIAEELESVDRVMIADVLNSVPSSWPVSDDVLEVVGWFLERRAPAVAERLRSPSATGGS
jgi:hypothetical protein